MWCGTETAMPHRERFLNAVVCYLETAAIDYPFKWFTKSIWIYNIKNMSYHYFLFSHLVKLHYAFENTFFSWKYFIHTSYEAPAVSIEENLSSKRELLL